VALVTGEIRSDSPEHEQARKIAERFPAIPFPDGWKANLLGVDLNLQYPAGWLQAREIKFAQGFTRPAPRDYVGRAPLTQREARALAEYTREEEPDLVLALHTQGKVIYWQFRDYQVPGARALAEEFARISGYALEDTPYESGFAGYKDWFIQEYRRPGFTIECGSGESPLPLSQFEEIYRDVLGILVTAALGLPERR
jgi:g-D-glutamyl-meso-diaminopimelate peptidase